MCFLKCLTTTGEARAVNVAKQQALKSRPSIQNPIFDSDVGTPSPQTSTELSTSGISPSSGSYSQLSGAEVIREVNLAQKLLRLGLFLILLNAITTIGLLPASVISPIAANTATVRLVFLIRLCNGGSRGKINIQSNV